MKIFISALICTVIMIINPIGRRAEVNSFQLESKILFGEPIEGGSHKYMASLQVNGSHICGSSMFQKKFLITSALCGWFIGKSIEKKKQKGTVVLGNPDLRYGQRVNILKIAYLTSYGMTILTRPIDDYDIGIIMVSDNVDYSRVDILRLHQESIHLSKYGHDAEVCGWGSLSNDKERDISLQPVQHSLYLHCMDLRFATALHCRPAIQRGEFKYKQICGRANFKAQTTTLADIGSPATKLMNIGDKYETVIVGITIDRHEGKKEKLLRFIRSSYIYNDAFDLVKLLQSKKIENMDYFCEMEEWVKNQLL